MRFTNCLEKEMRLAPMHQTLLFTSGICAWVIGDRGLKRCKLPLIILGMPQALSTVFSDRKPKKRFVDSKWICELLMMVSLDHKPKGHLMNNFGQGAVPSFIWGYNP